MKKSFLTILILCFVGGLGFTKGMVEEQPQMVKTADGTTISVKASPYYGFLRLEVTASGATIYPSVSRIFLSQHTVLVPEISLGLPSIRIKETGTGLLSARFPQKTSELNILADKTWWTSQADETAHFNNPPKRLGPLSVSVLSSAVSKVPPDSGKSKVVFLLPFLHPLDQTLQGDFYLNINGTVKRVSIWTTTAMEFYPGEKKDFEELAFNLPLLGGQTQEVQKVVRDAKTQNLPNFDVDDTIKLYRYFSSGIYTALLLETKDEINKLLENLEIVNGFFKELSESDRDQFLKGLPDPLKYAMARFDKFLSFQQENGSWDAGGYIDNLKNLANSFKAKLNSQNNLARLGSLVARLRNAVIKHLRPGSATSDFGTNRSVRIPTLTENPFELPEYLQTIPPYLSLYFCLSNKLEKPLFGDVISEYYPTYNPFNFRKINQREGRRISQAALEFLNAAPNPWWVGSIVKGGGSIGDYKDWVLSRTDLELAGKKKFENDIYGMKAFTSEAPKWTIKTLGTPGANDFANLNQIEIFASKNLLADAVFQGGKYVLDRSTPVYYVLLERADKVKEEIGFIKFSAETEEAGDKDYTTKTIQLTATSVQTINFPGNYHLFKVENPQAVKSLTLPFPGYYVKVFSENPFKDIGLFQIKDKKTFDIPLFTQTSAAEIRLLNGGEDLSKSFMILRKTSEHLGNDARIAEINFYTPSGRIPIIFQAETTASNLTLAKSFLLNRQKEKGWFFGYWETPVQQLFQIARLDHPMKYVKGGADGLKSYNYKILSSAYWLYKNNRDFDPYKVGRTSEADLVRSPDLTPDWTYTDQNIQETQKDTFSKTKTFGYFPYLIGATIPNKEGIITSVNSPFHINKLAGTDSLGLLTNAITYAGYNGLAEGRELFEDESDPMVTAPVLLGLVPSETLYTRGSLFVGLNRNYQTFNVGVGLTHQVCPDFFETKTSQIAIDPLNYKRSDYENFRLQAPDLEFNSIPIFDPNQIQPGDFLYGIEHGEPTVGIITSIGAELGKVRSFSEIRDQILVVSINQQTGHAFMGLWGNPGGVFGGFTRYPERFMVRRLVAVKDLAKNVRPLTAPWDLVTNAAFYSDLLDADWYFSPTAEAQVNYAHLFFQTPQADLEGKPNIHTLGKIWIKTGPLDHKTLFKQPDIRLKLQIYSPVLRQENGEWLSAESRIKDGTFFGKPLPYEVKFYVRKIGRNAEEDLRNNPIEIWSNRDSSLDKNLSNFYTTAAGNLIYKDDSGNKFEEFSICYINKSTPETHKFVVSGTEGGIMAIPRVYDTSASLFPNFAMELFPLTSPGRAIFTKQSEGVECLQRFVAANPQWYDYYQDPDDSKRPGLMDKVSIPFESIKAGLNIPVLPSKKERRFLDQKFWNRPMFRIFPGITDPTNKTPTLKNGNAYIQTTKEMDVQVVASGQPLEDYEYSMMNDFISSWVFQEFYYKATHHGQAIPEDLKVELNVNGKFWGASLEGIGTLLDITDLIPNGVSKAAKAGVKSVMKVLTEPVQGMGRVFFRVAHTVNTKLTKAVFRMTGLDLLNTNISRVLVNALREGLGGALKITKIFARPRKAGVYKLEKLFSTNDTLKTIEGNLFKAEGFKENDLLKILKDPKDLEELAALIGKSDADKRAGLRNLMERARSRTLGPLPSVEDLFESLKPWNADGAKQLNTIAQFLKENGKDWDLDKLKEAGLRIGDYPHPINKYTEKVGGVGISDLDLMYLMRRNAKTGKDEIWSLLDDAPSKIDGWDTLNPVEKAFRFRDFATGEEKKLMKQLEKVNEAYQAEGLGASGIIQHGPNLWAFEQYDLFHQARKYLSTPEGMKYLAGNPEEVISKLTKFIKESRNDGEETLKMFNDLVKAHAGKTPQLQVQEICDFFLHKLEYPATLQIHALEINALVDAERVIAKSANETLGQYAQKDRILAYRQGIENAGPLAREFTQDQLKGLQRWKKKIFEDNQVVKWDPVKQQYIDMETGAVYGARKFLQVVIQGNYVPRSLRAGEVLLVLMDRTGTLDKIIDVYRDGETLKTLGFGESLEPPKIRLYQVMDSINVNAGVAQGDPRLDAPGGGLVYRLGQPVQSLIQQGSLKELWRDE